ncbi:hypothetical protein LCGC14_1519500 [marine sediment metagenome]|uniref:Uncharacterized protein n=1 Tax=marine sediment metagenome TaxID=412755 RepID=A0A0F9M053_9ZZZZ
MIQSIVKKLEHYRIYNLKRIYREILYKKCYKRRIRQQNQNILKIKCELWRKRMKNLQKL